MGAYEDRYANFGRITSELWRAIRLVVDTGLHSMGWTKQQAIDYFASITSEIQRYIVTRGQTSGRSLDQPPEVANLQRPKGDAKGDANAAAHPLPRRAQGKSSGDNGGRLPHSDSL